MAITGYLLFRAIARGRRGRIVDIPIFGLTERELRSPGPPSGPGLIERLAGADLDQLVAPADSPDLLGYLDLTLRGGFPESVLAKTDEDRKTWLGAYISQLLSRDIPELTSRRRLDRRVLRRYLTALCLLHTGPTSYRLSNRIFALPISTLWGD